MRLEVLLLLTELILLLDEHLLSGHLGNRVLGLITRVDRLARVSVVRN